MWPVHTAGLAVALLSLQAAEPAPPACVGWNPITFDSGSAQLSARARATLDTFVSLLGESSYPSRVRLTGHADRVGSATANLHLSRRRAHAAAEYLISRGIPRERISVKAAGEGHGLVETDDGVAEEQNRLVEVDEELDAREWERRKAIWSRVGRPAMVC